MRLNPDYVREDFRAAGTFLMGAAGDDGSW
jgi:hypothetical protein